MNALVLRDVEGLKQHLAPHLRRARRAIVFGSVARGEADEWSDLDLVVIAETDRPFLERHRDFAGLYDVWPRLDLLIYTPAEVEQMRAEENPFIEHVLAEGVVVHETAES